MRQQIVIINGSGGVGKDTFVEFCSKYAKVRNISSVDKIKNVAEELGWDGCSKTEKDRKFLSDLKILATNYSDHSFNYIKQCIDLFKARGQFNILFIHLREPGEIEKVKRSFQHVNTLLITNNRVGQISSNMSDANVSKYRYDHIIHNDGTFRELEEKARLFVSVLA